MSLAAKLALALACIAGWALLVEWGAAWLERSRRTLLWAIYAGNRLAGLALWTLFAGAGTSSDLALYYLPQARKVLDGLTPNIDFPSSYAPLFTYSCAGLLFLVDHPASLVLALYAVEIASLVFFFRAFELGRVERRAQDELLAAYALNPLVAWYTAIGAYQSAVLALFVGLGLVWHRRAGASGLALGLGLPFTKLLAVLAWPAAVLRPRGWRALPGLAAGLALVLAFYAAGQDLLAPLARESERFTNGNALFLAASLSGTRINETLPGWAVAALFALLSGTLLALAARRRGTLALADTPQRAAAVVVLAWLAFMLTSRKALPMYYLVALPLMIGLAADLPRRRAALREALALGAASALATPVWTSLVGRPPQLTEALLQGAVAARAGALIVLILDGVAITLAVRFLLRAWRILVHDGDWTKRTAQSRKCDAKPVHEPLSR